MVNIKDFENKQKDFSGDKLTLIFDRQEELIKKYHPIEKRNELLLTEDIPVNLHDAKGQARLKDFAWRITEELGEALGAFELHPHLVDHYDEEIADALHFLVEFTILADLTQKELINSKWKLNYSVKEYVLKFVNPLCEDNLDFLFEYAIQFMEVKKVTSRKYEYLVFYTGKIIQELGQTCNTLKNKAWKQTHMLTDVLQFKINLKSTWINFIQLCLCANIFSTRLFELYFNKSEVNKFRIRSKY